jgi:hypothetical protein
VTLRPDRRALAGIVLLCWAGGLAVLARRRHDVSDVQRLAGGVLRLDPATYYYALSQNGTTLGDATSAIDTGAAGFRARNVVRIRPDSAASASQVEATSTAYLSRAFVLDSFTVSVTGTDSPLRLRAVTEKDSKLLLPTLAPIALILSRPPRVGARADQWLYNPVARRVQRVTMRIAAESLFTVVDSASYDSTLRMWTPAHSDTVRSWMIVTPSRGVFAWVDAHGRIVAAGEPGGASMIRTAYEIALLNDARGAR